MMNLRIAALLLILLIPSAAATHDDGRFDQPVNIYWDTTEIDIVVIPATAGQPGNASDANPLNNSFRRGIVNTVLAWEEAIDVYGSDWLRDSVFLRLHMAESGDPTADDAEIIILHTEAGGAGFAVNDQPTCDRYGCGDLGPACIVHAGPTLNFEFDPTASRNTHAHELGHCLGLGHVGDGDNPETFHPEEDLMSYGMKPYPLHCVSNLNVAGLEHAFGPIRGWERNSSISMPVEDYRQMDCNQNGHPVNFSEPNVSSDVPEQNEPSPAESPSAGFISVISATLATIFAVRINRYR